MTDQPPPTPDADRAPARWITIMLGAGAALAALSLFGKALDAEGDPRQVDLVMLAVLAGWVGLVLVVVRRRWVRRAVERAARRRQALDL